MIQLSASKLGILRECERCFWDINNSKFARPRGIFSSLPGGIDLVMKNYFNQFRGTLPPGFKGKVEGVLMEDLLTLNKWRNWKSGMNWEDGKIGVKIIGAFDDCLVNYPSTKEAEEETYMPLDNKTKGAKPKDNGAQYYQLQLDIYGLLLQGNGYRINNKAYLAYFYPVKIFDPLPDTAFGKDPAVKLGMDLPFGVDIYCLESSPDRAVKEITRAVEILKGERPDPAPDCEYCKYGLLYPRGGDK